MREHRSARLRVLRVERTSITPIPGSDSTTNHSHDFPYPISGKTKWQEGIGRLDLAWNNVPGYCETARPMINHWARGYSGEFDDRLKRLQVDSASSS